MQIMTVRGAINPGDLGFTMMHEHLWCDLYRYDRHLAGILNDEALITEEVGAYRKAGGSALVEVTSLGLDRNPPVLRRISERTGLHVIMGCGWYRQSHYPPEIEWTSTNALAAIIERDLTDGVDGIRAGIIGELGTDRHYISPAEERVFRAGARAQKRTGIAITTHAFGYPVGLDQLDLLEEEGIDPGRVIIGHADSYPNRDYHEAILARGAYVQFDLVGKFLACTDAQRVRLIVELLGRGHVQRLLLSSDTCMRTSLHAHGGPGYDHLILKFLPALRAAGVSEEQIHMIMVENPRQVLAV
jgi:predicted metal-dependent phosphotriesterase family hydrolase